MATNLGTASGSLELDISGFVTALKDAQSEASTVTGKIESSADGLGSAFKSAGRDAGDGFADGLDTGLAGTKGSFDPVKTESDKTKGPMKESGKESGEEFISGLKTAIAGIAAAGIFSAIVSSVQELTEVANETQEDMGKLDTAFRTSGHTAETANAVYREMVGILGETDQAVEASNHLAKLSQDEQVLAQWTDIATGVYATFGDSLPIEGLTEAANETAKVAQVTGPFADAINWASQTAEQLGDTLSGNTAAQEAYYAALEAGENKEDAYTAALQAVTDEQERAQVVTDTLTGLYRDAASAYGETNGELIEYRKSQDDLKQKMSDFGEALMPIQTEVSNLGTSFLEGLQPAVQWLSDNMPAVKATFELLAPAVAMVAGGFAAYQAFTTVSGIITAVKTALDGMAASQAIVNAVMNANPVMLVVTALGALVGALAWAWATNEDFRNIVTNAWNAIKTVASDVFGALVTFFTSTIPNAIGSFISVVMSVPGRVASALGNVLSAVGRFVGNFASAAINAASSFASNIVSGLSSLPGQVMSIGSNIVSGIWNGISGAAGWLCDKIAGFAGGLVDKVKSVLGIASPSRVFARQVGKWIPAGVAMGADQAMPAAFGEIETAFESAAKDMSVAGVVDAVKRPFDSLSGSVHGSVQRLLAGNGPMVYGSAVPYQPRRARRGYTSSESVYAGNTGGGDTYNFYSPKALNEIEAARQMKRARRELAEGF